MSQKPRSSKRTRPRSRAHVFFALGDDTRLALLTRLAGGRPHSISQLTAGSKLTRQAITKHLHVLQAVGIVRGIRAGRERLFEFDPQPIKEAKDYLDLVSRQWDEALGRLKAMVED